MSEKKILIVEDEMPIARDIQNMVLKMGYSVSGIALSGDEALKKAEENPPDLVLMDINMEDLDGYEVATRLRNTPGLEKTPIVALTVNVMVGDRERALTAGCDGYIPKPIDVDLLPRQVQAYLSGQRERVPESRLSFYLEEYSRKLVERLES